MVDGNFWTATGLSAVIVGLVVNFLKVRVLDRLIDPSSVAYNYVTRGLVFALNLLANAVGFLLMGGSWSGAWAIIVAGLASTGISLTSFHYQKFTTNKRALINAPVLPPMVTKIVTPMAAPSPTITKTTLTNP